MLILSPSRSNGQVSVQGADTAEVVAEPGDVLGSARSAQADFERRRTRHLPLTFAAYGGRCDEVVGRLCTWYGEGEWTPEPEPEEVRALRADLLAALDSLQELAPAESWVLGQRVWYRAEGGDWAGALAAARECRAPTWWCAALEGLSLHGLGEHRGAEAAFERALRAMDEERARSWRMPERALDSEAWKVVREADRVGPDSLAAVLDRLWGLSDPLYLIDGNDRLTEHYARWTVATLKDGARNQHRIRWGRDLEELTVRHGWEIGWERSPSRTLGGPFGVTAHKHPEAREYLPSGETLAAPAEAEPDRFLADRRRAKSLYAPPYAPVILPMEGQLAVFPRVGSTVVVATAFLPEDTTFHADHDHARPWLEPGDQAGMPDRIGLFALPDGELRRARRVVETGSATGALMLELPVGGYVLSVESWSPEARRAGRLRTGLGAREVPPDVAALSDLLLVSGEGAAPASLEEALPTALARPEITPEQPLGIAWEVAGLGFRPETLVFELSVDRTDRNVLRRLVDLLGISERPPSLALSWEEPAPDHPTHLFRHLDLDLPPLDPGEYRVTLTLRTAGRSDVEATRTFRVTEPD